jgi:23S rRNA (guanosine2251-2'-O)-methyltransferase
MTKKVILEGRNTINDAILSGKPITSISIAQESVGDDKIREIVDLAKNHHIPVMTTTSKHIKQKTHSDTAQNIMAEMELEDITLEDILQKKDPVILIYNRLDYEQNLGAIMRTAWGAGVDAVIVSQHGVHELTPVVSKVSMGGAAYVPLLSESLFPALKVIQDKGIPVVGVESGMGESYTEQNLTGPVAFVFGGEDSGLSDPLKKYCDVFVHIPLKSDLSSLNVSVATAVILFEKLRQERQ